MKNVFYYIVILLIVCSAFAYTSFQHKQVIDRNPQPLETQSVFVGKYLEISEVYTIDDAQPYTSFGVDSSKGYTAVELPCCPSYGWSCMIQDVGLNAARYPIRIKEEHGETIYIITENAGFVTFQFFGHKYDGGKGWVMR